MELSKQGDGRISARASGLDGVVVADTALSDVDGERGRLVVAGHDIEALAGRVSFEQLCALLWTGQSGDAALQEEVRAGLAAGRALAWSKLSGLGDALDASDGGAALICAVSHLGTSALTSKNGDASKVFYDLALVTGAVATFVAAWSRRSAGLAPIEPDASRTHAADYLRMSLGVEPDVAVAKALETYLVTVADHSMNASTFTARVVASTGSDLVSSIVAALGALKGPLHGGAPGPVLDMLDAVGEASRAEAWVKAELDAGRRIMGMGHRIYRVRDPRAAVLERAATVLERAGVRSDRLGLARAVERAAESVLAARHPDRPLKANVEFYTAILLDAVGISRSSFMPTFAVGRTAGWCAHVVEQRRTGRLVRPSSRYIGVFPDAFEAETKTT